MTPLDPPICIFCRGNKKAPCRPNGQFNPDFLARSYLEEFNATFGGEQNKEKALELEWARDCVMDLEYSAPEVVFQVILLAMVLLKDSKQAGFLAAGTLETLIVNNGPEFIERIEFLAQRSPRFRYLLTGVWSQGTDQTEVWRRVVNARKPGPSIDASNPMPEVGLLSPFL